MKCSKSAIPWCDYGASPVAGCQHSCGDSFCYARSMVRRYGAPDVPGLHVLDAPVFAPTKASLGNPMDPSESAMPYPFGWAPTFHRYRLDVPSPRKPGRVFVCPMADMWGAWVPPTWQDEVLAACAREPRHDYLFLTKNPTAYHRIDWHDKTWAWLGATATGCRVASLSAESMRCSVEIWAADPVRFLSLEPWLDGDTGVRFVEACVDKSGAHYADWLILGPLTGSKARTAPPVSRNVVLRLRDACQRAGVALYVKPSAKVWGLTPDEIASMQAFPRPHPSER